MEKYQLLFSPGPQEKIVYVVQMLYKGIVMCAEPFEEKGKARKAANDGDGVLGWMEAFGGDVNDFKIVTVEIPIPALPN